MSLTSGTLETSSKRNRPPHLKPIRCKKFNPHTKAQRDSRHVDNDPSCIFVHPGDPGWDMATINRRAEAAIEGSSPYRRRSPSPPRSRRIGRSSFSPIRDHGYGDRVGQSLARDRSHSPRRRSRDGSRASGAPTEPSGWGRAKTSSSQRASSPSLPDVSSRKDFLVPTSSPSHPLLGAVPKASKASEKSSPPSPITIFDPPRNSGTAWLPISNTSETPTDALKPTSTSSGFPVAPVSHPPVPSSSPVTVAGELMDIDPHGAAEAPGAPPLDNITKEFMRDVTLKRIKMYYDAITTHRRIEKRKEEIELLSPHSGSSVAEFTLPKARVAELVLQNVQDMGRLQSQIDELNGESDPMWPTQTALFDPRRDSAPSTLRQSIHELKALLEAVSASENTTGTSSESKIPNTSSTNALPPPADAKLGSSSKKRKADELSDTRPDTAVKNEEEKKQVSSRRMKALESSLMDTQEQLHNANLAIAEWAEKLGDEIHDRFDGIGETKTKKHADENKATVEIRAKLDAYEADRARDRQKFTDLATAAANENARITQLNSERMMLMDRLSAIEKKQDALHHATSALAQSRAFAGSGGTSADDTNQDLKVLFDKLTIEVLEKAKADVEPLLIDAIRAADEEASRQHSTVFASVLNKLHPTIQLAKMMEDWISSMEDDSSRSENVQAQST